ncbi:MAG: hypothetical protein KKA73_13435 [Chloroflexi bacterium]|nr:hypothetical protein [Chloroflexota bacterium]MBU1748684.1 hypothetical protein [Chloroflexota bacterium]
MRTRVTYEGFDELIRDLEAVDYAAAGQVAAVAGAEEVRGVMTPYPPQPAPANPDRYYVRGYGQRWKRKDGSEGGRQTSEQLGQSWAVEQEGTGAILGTRVSYAPPVQGAETQTGRHAATGWKTDEQAVNEVLESGVIDDMLFDAVLGQLRGR